MKWTEQQTKAISCSIPPSTHRARLHQIKSKQAPQTSLELSPRASSLPLPGQPGPPGAPPASSPFHCPIPTRLRKPPDVPPAAALDGDVLPVEGVVGVEKDEPKQRGKEERLQAGWEGAWPLCPLQLSP